MWEQEENEAGRVGVQEQEEARWSMIDEFQDQRLQIMVDLGFGRASGEVSWTRLPSNLIEDRGQDRPLQRNDCY